MRRCFLLRAVLLLAVFAAPPAAPAEPYFGILRVKTTPSDCTYSVDGTLYQKSQAVEGVDELPIGHHRIECTRENRTLVQEIDLRRGEVIVVDADFLAGKISWHYSAIQGIKFQGTKSPPGDGFTFGAVVMSVNENSTFKGYDIRPGDIVVRVGGETFATSDEYLDLVFATLPGEPIAYTIIRQGQIIEKQVRHLPRSWENVRRWIELDPSLFVISK